MPLFMPMVISCTLQLRAVPRNSPRLAKATRRGAGAVTLVPRNTLLASYPLYDSLWEASRALGVSFGPSKPWTAVSVVANMVHVSVMSMHVHADMPA